MTPRGRASRLPAALLLLWVPGCLSQSGPKHVTGTVGGSLSVQCRYEKEFKENNKYWCNGFCLLKIVATTKSEKEVTRGRVSIRDHPANLTFTVTLESLTEDDEGTYWCGIERPWKDVTFEVEVSVSPGYLSLSGPRRVTGTVGGSLSVHCRYEKEYIDHNKFWCNSLCLVRIVETTESEREVRRGRVSIRDHPATLTFTVTLESLTEDDEGRYRCGIDRSWTDLTFEVVVSVSPATSRPTTSTSTTIAMTSTVSAQTPTVSSAPAVNATRSKNSQDGAQPSPDHRLPVLLILLALLLLLLVGASLLAWRMVRRRVKAAGNPEPLQKPCQAAPQSEPCYANLELQTRPLQAEPEHPWQEEVEYSLVQPPREDLHYSTVVFTAQHRDPEDQSPSQRRPPQEPEYSVVRKT